MKFINNKELLKKLKLKLKFKLDKKLLHKKKLIELLNKKLKLLKKPNNKDN